MDSPVAPFKTVVVDLAPVLPGGENGGAKILALNLVRHLATAAPETRFILFTSRRSDDELSALDAPNVERFRVDAPATQRSTLENATLMAAGLLRRVLPTAALGRVAAVYAQLNRLQGASTLLRRFGADLLFCPFTAPTFDDGVTPFVSIVHDLQHRYFPQNFDRRLKDQLDRRLKHVIDRAARIICVSDYVRETMLEAGACPERLETIHTALHARMRTISNADANSALAKWRLSRGRYLLYPANFWPHKNHSNLVHAFRLWVQTNPESDIKVVLTGAPGDDRDRVIHLVQTTRLAERVIFPGFVPDDEFAALLQHCLAVIFPSLYEGFGMPAVEAMAAGKPVLCSNVASLPEITSGAALMFDPRDIAAIARAIGQIECDGKLRSTVVERGLCRAASFGDAELMAARYLRSFKAVLKTQC